MSAPLHALHKLLIESVRQWRVPAQVTRQDDDRVVITGLGHLITIARADQGMPYRWMIASGGRQRPALSVVSVLRQVRLVLDPTYAKLRLSVSAPPVQPPR